MIYLISDVHGRYEEFVRLLRKVRFRKTDQLYVLGDVIDRGENNLKMLDFCRLEENVTLLKGNHELFMQRYLEGSPWLREHWKSWEEIRPSGNWNRPQRRKKKSICSISRGFLTGNVCG